MLIQLRGKRACLRTLGTFMLTLLACPVWAAGPSSMQDPAALVNPLLGTGSGGKVVGNVNTFPGAVMPFGMLSWSPTTRSRTPGGDYSWKDSSIEGFSLTHVSGPGCGAGGEVPILPTVGAVDSDPEKASQHFDHAHEHASPGIYRVTLAPGSTSPIAVKLSATTRTGIGVFHFPATDHANVLFKVGDAQSPTSVAGVHVVGDHELAGLETSGHFCGTPSTATMYFVATFNRPFHAHGVWQGSGSSARHGVAGSGSGAWVSFDTRQHADVKLKVAISYVSTADAWANLRAENPGWSVDAVADKARKSWSTLLSSVAVQGGTRDQRVQFYTAMYHAFLHPNVFSDANGDYIGYDDKVHQLEKDQGAQYANFSGWDIYRSEVPLLALLVPDRTGDMVRSLLNDQAQGGWLPKWGYDNDYTGVMNGDAADPIIAEAYAFGVRDFDAQSALKAMVKGATQIPRGTYQRGQAWYEERPDLEAYQTLGYVPDDVSATLEYATADFAIARLAKALGKTSIHDKFLARSQNWTKIFDAAAKFRGFAGYMEPRKADGSFPAGPAFKVKPHAFGQPGFQEGNTTQYTWMVPQNLRGLIQAMGGHAKVVKRLDTLFTHLNVGPNKPYYWAGNEPNLGIPWIYDYAGKPYKTQAIVHRLIANVYANTPGGEPGNDDLGATSSWLVWADMGLYPETPGSPVLVLGAPIFPKISIHLRNHHVVQLSAPGASLHSFVRGLKINGTTWTKDWIQVAQLLDHETSGTKGGNTTLSFKMGPKPDTGWATSAADEPPSYPAAGALRLPHPAPATDNAAAAHHSSVGQ